MLDKDKKLRDLKLEKLKIEKKLEKIRRDNLPHLYGFPWYTWARTFFESTNDVTILCAGNQISKSSTQIRKAIHWATEKTLWKKLWPMNPTPRQFWYLYPAKDVSTAEFETKWEPEFMPRNEMKEDDKYGWEVIYKAGYVHHILFNSGVRIYFKHYSQDSSKLQSGTCTVSFTQIETSIGFKNVQDIVVGDIVRTREGFKPVISTMNRIAEVMDLELSNGQSLTITPNHRIFTENRGWVEASLVTADDIGVYSPLWKHRLKLHSTVRHIQDHLIQSIGTTEIITLDNSELMGKGLENRSIMLNIAGSMDLIKSQKGLISTIQTMTCLTMISIILKWSDMLNMLNTTQTKVLKTSKQHINISEIIKSKLKITVLRPIKLDGIRRLVWNVQHALRSLLTPMELSTAQVNVTLGRDPRSGLRTAVNAVRSTKLREKHLGSAVTPALEVTEKLRKEIVYNIEVAECPEYFANGVLIHNCHAIYTDEELPENLFDELLFRLSAVEGHFSQVFTATLGQKFWHDAIERIGQKDEVLKTALKLQVSRWECLEYEEGSKHIPTPWTPEKIRAAEAKCSSQNEIDKRINGRFVMDDGLKYASFKKQENVVEPYFDKIKKEKWYIYSGTDIGSGGKSGHPASIAFIAVRPDFQKAAVFKGWKSPKNQDITSPDILKKYQELRGNMKTICAYYDWAASDFKVHANRLGESFQKAEKGHDIGEDTLNSLFKHKMLDIFDIEELEDLPWELGSLLKDTPKRVAKDDFCDAVRYGVTKIPWDWTAVGDEYSEYQEPKVELNADAQEIENRRTMHHQKDEFDDGIEDEIAYYNDLYEG